MRLEDYKVEDFTHVLICSHCIGRNCKDYVMKCTIVKTMPDGRVKVVVFGARYWKDTEHIKRVRYVHKHRLRLKQP